MISPIGSTIVRVDTAMMAAMDLGIQGLVAYLYLPVSTCLAIYYIIQGVRIAKGDGAPIDHFFTELLRNVTILWFCSNAAVYNRWVRNFFYLDLPTALNKAVISGALGAGGANIANGVQGTAAVFDQIWALMDVIVDRVLVEAPLFDVSSRLAAMAAGLTGGLLLMVIAAVYMLSRFILAVVLELGDIAIACRIFEITKGVFERWLGKIISLMFLQVAMIVVLQIILTIDQDFMKQIIASHGSLASDIQALTAMVIAFFAAAFLVYSLPAVAYSLGTGVSVSAMPALYLAAKAMQGAAGALSGLSIPAVGGAAGAAEELSLGVAQAEIGAAGGSAMRSAGAALPPPPLLLPGD